MNDTYKARKTNSFMKYNIIFTILLLMAFVPIVQSAPVTEILERGVDIVYPEIEFIKAGQDLEINFWTYQSSDGQTLTNTSLNCTAYLMNSQGVNFFRFSNRAGANGLITYGKGAPLCVNCWTMILGAGNLSVGTYSYQFKCQGNDLTTPTALKIGGYNVGTFTVTPSGFGDTLGFYLIIILLLFLLIFMGFSIGEEWFVILGGLGLMMLGIYSINSGVAGFKDMFMTWGVGLFEIGVGFILSIKSSFELFKD